MFFVKKKKILGPTTALGSHIANLKRTKKNPKRLTTSAWANGDACGELLQVPRGVLISEISG